VPEASAHPALLGVGDPSPCEVVEAVSDSPFVLLADHAGQRVPTRLDNLGLPQAELDRHIGWDIGIAAVTRLLAEQLGAWAILQRYSRLVIDCNRPPAAPDSVATHSDGTRIPGNAGLDAAALRQRRNEIFDPYHQRIEQELDRRQQSGASPILVAMHSFTPAMAGQARPWHVGVLYQRDSRLAGLLLHTLRGEPGLVVGDNQPYSVSDATDYAIPVHGERRGLLHVELELRQDLVAGRSGQQQWTARLARLLADLPVGLTRP